MTEAVAIEAGEPTIAIVIYICHPLHYSTATNAVIRFVCIPAHLSGATSTNSANSTESYSDNVLLKRYVKTDE